MNLPLKSIRIHPDNSPALMSFLQVCRRRPQSVPFLTDVFEALLNDEKLSVTVEPKDG